MNYHFNIETYTSFIFSEDQASRSALIKLWSLDRNKLVWVNFRDEGQTMPENRVEQRPDGRVWFHIQLLSSKYGWCIDLLRNERPVGIRYNEDTNFFSLNTTSREPVGEEEESLQDQ